jgi:phage gp29-like protein
VGASSTSSIAKTSKDIGRWVASSQQTDYGAYFRDQEIPHPSPILRDHSQAGQRLGELYDVMLRTDATLAGLWEKRWKAVAGLPWDLVPGDESPLAMEIRDQARRMIDNISDIETNLEHLMGARPRGVAFEEKRYELVKTGPLAGMWCAVEMIDRPMWRFGFKNINGVDQLHVRTKTGQLELVDPLHFIYYRAGTKDDPWGGCPTLLDQVYWFYYLTLHAFKYAGVALEKWAQPTIVGKYKRDLTVEGENSANESHIADLLSAISDFQTEFGVVIPDDLQMDLMEATRSGSVGYESFITLLDRAKALVILGEVDTSGLAKGPGSFAKSRVSNEVRLETIRMDGRGVASVLTNQLVAPFVAMNYGPGVPMPRWEWDIEDAEPREARQNGAQALLNMGLEVPTGHLYRINQVPRPKPGDETVRTQQVIGDVSVPRSAPPREEREEERAAAWDQQIIKRASA